VRAAVVVVITLRRGVLVKPFGQVKIHHHLRSSSGST
jgi:hypothetical protein